MLPATATAGRSLWYYIGISLAVHLCALVWGFDFRRPEKPITSLVFSIRLTEPVERPAPPACPPHSLPEAPAQIVAASAPSVSVRPPVRVRPAVRAPAPVPKPPQVSAPKDTFPTESTLADIPEPASSELPPGKNEAEPVARPDPPAAPDDPQARHAYLNMIRQRIEERKAYPKQARLRKFEGKVIVECVLSTSGQVTSIKVAQGSRFGVLDKAALKAVEDASPFPKPPQDLFKEDIRLRIALVFELV